MKYKYIKKVSKLLYKYDLMDLVELTGLEDEYDLEAELILKKCRIDSIYNAERDIEKIFKDCFFSSTKLDEEKLEALSIEVIKTIKEINKNK
ncbi:hypothetical protein [Clostridium paridis]|uniref:Uncharacterized protein n=1 Tax=Clostridium paridis TaxID=2803863 RepID=A0A937FG44_9CLOT|nr:hypothetical protein [Clostridium paridis]MBL4933174.1 hypothetical protein [Clostridium paridis]